MIKERATARPGEESRFEKPEKIIVYRFLDKNNRYVSIFDNEQFYAISSTYIIAPLEQMEVSLRYVTAILNSKFMGFINSELFSGIKVTRTELLRTPIHDIEFSTEPSQRTAVVNTAKTHYEQGNTAALLAWAAAELAANRNDTIHDLLAHLAEQMIALNQQKQAALEAFWLDLEGVTDPNPFDTLRNKGKQQATLHKNVPAARAFVDESSRSTITLDATLGWNEDAFKGMVKELVGSVSGLSKLVQVYRDHAPSVAALNQRLTTTDHLIDQIVYKLYNLTPTEIAIVEGGENG